MKQRFTEPQIVGFLGKADAGIPVDAKRLKALEIENTRLKKWLAESPVENEVTREAVQTEL